MIISILVKSKYHIKIHPRQSPAVILQVDHSSSFKLCSSDVRRSDVAKMSSDMIFPRIPSSQSPCVSVSTRDLERDSEPHADTICLLCMDTIHFLPLGDKVFFRGYQESHASLMADGGSVGSSRGL